MREVNIVLLNGTEIPYENHKDSAKELLEDFNSNAEKVWQIDHEGKTYVFKAESILFIEIDNEENQNNYDINEYTPTGFEY